MNIIHSHKKYREVKMFATFLFQKNIKRESNMVRKFCFTFTTYEYNP